MRSLAAGRHKKGIKEQEEIEKEGHTRKDLLSFCVSFDDGIRIV
jgi:hypothetical protein